MTISTTENRKSYAGNGITTSFAFPYWFPEDTDLVVLLVTDSTGVPVTQVLTTNYTVSGADDASGGAVEMTVAPASGETLVIYRDIARTQGLDLVEKDEFPVDEVEKALDRQVAVSQRFIDLVERSLRQPDSESSSVAMELPNEIARASSFLAFDATGKPVAAAGSSANLGPVSAFIDTLLDDADAETARRTLETLSGANLAAATGTDTYLSTNTPVFTTLVTGAIYAVDIPNTNTLVAPSLAVDGIAAKTIKRIDGAALVAGDIKGRHLLQYDGTDFLLLNPPALTNSFSAEVSAQQTVFNNDTKVVYDTEVFDTNGDYDAVTNFRFTPKTAGKYLLTARFQLKLLASGETVSIKIYKNGAAYRENKEVVGFSDKALSISEVVPANGTTDYFEIYVRNYSNNSYTLEGDPLMGYFSGARV